MLTAKFNYPDNGYDGDIKFAASQLQVGHEYEVDCICMGQSYTSVYFVGFEKPFNSVQFDFFEDGEEIDIYRSPKYNPYL